MGSEVLWRCEPAASASVCPEAERQHVAPGAIRPRPPGRQVAPPAPPPLELPAGLGGRLRGRKTQSFIVKSRKNNLGYWDVCVLCTVFHVTVTGGEARRGGEVFLTAGQVM